RHGFLAGIRATARRVPVRLELPCVRPSGRRRLVRVRRPGRRRVLRLRHEPDGLPPERRPAREVAAGRAVPLPPLNLTGRHADAQGVSVNDLVLVQGMRDTKFALRRWNDSPGAVLRPWCLLSAAIAVALLWAVYAV